MIIKERDDLPFFLNLLNCKIGIELGVSEGKFSEHLLQNSHLTKLFSVDKWDGEREHNLAEYYKAITRLNPYGDRSVVLRATFKEAFDFFPDDYFDFIYIDGFAFTGNREEILSWWVKLKQGGIYSGHDFADEYPLVKEAVNEFMKKNDIKNISFTDEILSSWVITK